MQQEVQEIKEGLALDKEWHLRVNALGRLEALVGNQHADPVTLGPLIAGLLEPLAAQIADRRDLCQAERPCAHACCKQRHSCLYSRSTPKRGCVASLPQDAAWHPASNSSHAAIFTVTQSAGSSISLPGSARGQQRSS